MKEFDDILIKNAVLHCFNENFSKIERESKDITFSKKFIEKMNNFLIRQSKITFKLTYTKTRKIICVIAAVLVIMLSSLTVGAVRKAISNFFVVHFSNYADVTYKPSNPEIFKEHKPPEIIEKEYELGYIPKGYKLEERLRIDNFIDETYYGDDKRYYLIFNQYTKNDFNPAMDNEHSTITTEIINGREYLIQSSKDYEYYCFVWENEDYIFSICAYLPKEEVIKLCESVKIKEN